MLLKKANSEQVENVGEFDETAVFFLMPRAQQKLEVSFNTRWVFFRQDFQIMLDGVCLESGISESELEQGKTYPLPDNKTIFIKFLGNNAAVWVDEDLVPLNHTENNRQIDPWESVTLMMYVGGGLGILLGIWQLFSLSDVDFGSSSFWIDFVSSVFLGVILLICGYVGRQQQKLWTLWLGNGILLIFLFAWFYFTFYVDWENFRITRTIYTASFVFLAVEQVKNTKKTIVFSDKTKIENEQ